MKLKQSGSTVTATRTQRWFIDILTGDEYMLDLLSPVTSLVVQYSISSAKYFLKTQRHFLRAANTVSTIYMIKWTKRVAYQFWRTYFSVTNITQLA